MTKGREILKFRCTECGNCCREPLLPLTDADIRRIVERNGDNVEEFVKWVDRDGIDMDDEPEGFVMLRQGKRVMVLRHGRGRCRYLGPDERCTIYTSRPAGCRVFPLDADFTRAGKLKKIALMASVECPYELDGKNDLRTLRSVTNMFVREEDEYREVVAKWNKMQRARKRKGQAAQTARDFLIYLGLVTPPSSARPKPTRKAAKSRKPTGAAGRSRAGSRARAR